MKKDQKNKIWVGTEELTNDPEFKRLAHNEFEEKNIAETLADASDLPITSNRRDFLKYLGFGLGAATVAASCDIPVRKAIPYVVKPDEIVPGVANYYASSFVRGGDYCAVLVKTREGRPIKIEGNTLSSVTKGGTNARAQASVLSLYDTTRLQHPGKINAGKVEKMSWTDLDNEVGSKLTAAATIRIVSNTIMSPTHKRALEEFKAKYPNTELVVYDAISNAGLLEANEATFGQSVIPSYHFDKADVIVSLGADFLGTWISPVEYAVQYGKNRKIKDTKNAKMSRHIQVESHMSLTGSNADNRILIRPSEMGAAIAVLHNEVAAQTGGQSVPAPKLNDRAATALKKTAEQLAANRGKSLIVSGSNNVGEQILVNSINQMLGNYGKTLDFTNASLQRQGNDKDIQRLITEMEAGSVDVLFVMNNTNPGFDIPNSSQFLSAMDKVATKIFFGGSMNETGIKCNYAAPDNHFLESWGDAEPKRGHYSLIQPTIRQLFDTRQESETLLRWCGSENLDTTAEQPYFEYLKLTWQKNIFPKQSKFINFQTFWDASLHDGIFEAPGTGQSSPAFAADVMAAAAKINKPSNADLEIAFFETVNMGDGAYANNPWLQELPDPVTRCVWGNYLSIPVKWDGGHVIEGYKNLNKREINGEADKVELRVGSISQTVTCVKQFGLAPNTVSLAIGYGRTVSGPASESVGKNVYPWLELDDNGNVRYYATGATISGRVGVDNYFACVQYHHTMGVKDVDPETNEVVNVDEETLAVIGGGFEGALTERSVIQNTNLKHLEPFLEELHQKREYFEHLNQQTLYPYEAYNEDIYSQGHHWGMHLDLNACIGCGSCAVACIAENNVPIVGKYEVARHHEMTWLRIDRYFYGDFDNPNVVYQPMMCQHCDNAPCENVCPVAATNHSSEGLNQMAYNRCVGTRYCANNCPYKVRRFNWLDYTSADLFPANEVDLNRGQEDAQEAAYYMTDNLTRMVLNPDVTVRSRGVMEKCSFCVQRIQEGKLLAKQEGRKLIDSDVRTACQTACPTGAITFGDMNNKEGDLDKKIQNPLNYMALEEVNTRPSVYYTAKVINKDEDMMS